MSTKEKSVQEQVKQIIADNLEKKIEELQDETRLNDLGADSLDKAEMMIAIEEQFDVQISNEDLGKMDTIGDVVKIITEKIIDV